MVRVAEAKMMVDRVDCEVRQVVLVVEVVLVRGNAQRTLQFT